MDTLTFDLREIMTLIKIETEGKKGKRPYAWTGEVDDKPVHGLILVGDQGIYFMANTPDQVKTESGRNTVAYAKECNPDTMDVDELYDVKREIFGGDDGAEFFTIPRIMHWLGRGKYQIHMTPEEITFI